MRFSLVVSAWLLTVVTGPAAEIPELILPAGVGVNIHFTTRHEKDLDLIASAGFRFIRMDFAWAGTERTQGQYDWAAYDSLTSQLEKRGLRAIYILDYSNPLYEKPVASKNPLTGEDHFDTSSPQHPESIAAFAKWAAASAKHFRNRHVIWEIWNEPNISFWKPKPDVEQYIALALATCRAVREADPAATIIGPATSGVPMDFLESFCKSGVLDWLDAVSVHPYRNYIKPPESAAEDYVKLAALIERYAPAGKRLPMISGEWGYASHTSGVSLETQAAFAARQQLANLLQGVPLSIWYDWKNDGEEAKEREHNFGTVWPDLAPKPAYRAFQTLTRELGGYRIERRAKTANKEYVLVFRNAAGEQKIAAWTTGEPATVSLVLEQLESNAQARISSMDGSISTLPLKNQLLLELRPAPVYVTIAPARLAEER